MRTGKSMKKYVIVCLLVLFLTIPTSTHGKSGIERSLEIFVPIACTGPDFGFKNRIGTGFPVGRQMLMTARHIDCGEANIMEISPDHGITWETIPPENRFVSTSFDVQFIQTTTIFRKRSEERRVGK